MSRRIICSEFDSNARRMAAPLVLAKGYPRITLEDSPLGNWNWPAPHRSIRDCVPVREIAVEPVALSNLSIPPHKHTIVSEKEQRHCNRYAIHGTGGYTHLVWKPIRRNRKTIAARRKELVQLLRHEGRAMEQHILKQLDAFDRKEF